MLSEAAVLADVAADDEVGVAVGFPASGGRRADGDIPAERVAAFAGREEEELADSGEISGGGAVADPGGCDGCGEGNLQGGAGVFGKCRAGDGKPLIAIPVIQCEVSGGIGAIGPLAAVKVGAADGFRADEVDFQGFAGVAFAEPARGIVHVSIDGVPGEVVVADAGGGGGPPGGEVEGDAGAGRMPLFVAIFIRIGREQGDFAQGAAAVVTADQAEPVRGGGGVENDVHFRVCVAGDRRAGDVDPAVAVVILNPEVLPELDGVFREEQSRVGVGAGQGDPARVGDFEPVGAGVVAGAPTCEVAGGAVHREVRDVGRVVNAGGDLLVFREIHPPGSRVGGGQRNRGADRGQEQGREAEPRRTGGGWTRHGGTWQSVWNCECSGEVD